MKTRSLKHLSNFARIAALGCATLALSVPMFAQAAADQDGPPPGGGMRGGMGRGMGVRGTVTAVAGNQITIKTEEGDTYKVTTGDNTRIMKQREPATASEIKVGDMLMVGGQVDADAKTVGAAFVAIVDAEQVKKMQAELGKTWISGKITAIEDTKITVERVDGVAQTIAVDENTSFRKRRDSITMADIKVGDRLNARGALKDGVFVVAELNVGGMGGGMGMGRGRAGGSGPRGDSAPPPPADAPKP